MEEMTKDNKIYIIEKYVNNNNNNNDNKYFKIVTDIINIYKLEHSSNMNGLFLNMTILDDNIIDDIYLRFTNMNNTITDTKVDNTNVDNNDISLQFTKYVEKNEIDILKLKKFDKFLLQQSRSNISI